MNNVLQPIYNSFIENNTDPNTQIFHLKNNQLEILVSNLGATIVGITAPDRNGVYENICLGYKSAKEYLNGSSYFGAAVGPLANRIAEGQFVVNGNRYQLPVQDGKNSLHSGSFGFSNVLWEVIDVCENAIELSFSLKALENVYPANVLFSLKYTLTESDELDMCCDITSDGKAPVTFTQHNYYNLKGEGCGNITDHNIAINADHIVEVLEDFIPTGFLLPVINTPFDFNTPAIISEKINDKHEQMEIAGGFDHTFAFCKGRDMKLPVVTVVSPKSGRKMEMFTNQPGVQFYTGNFLDGNDIGSSGKSYMHRGGFCLEAQNYPDAVNQTGFPDPFVDIDKPQRFHARYKFSVV